MAGVPAIFREQIGNKLREELCDGESATGPGE